MDRMKSGLLIAVFVAFSVVALTAMPIVQASNSVIYVPENYTLIQDAIDAASSGDTIIVREGTYKENILVDKSITIRSENGPDSTIVRAEYPDLPAFEVTADHVNISGFTVKGAYEDAGIYLYTADYCYISSNICGDNKYGIHLIFSKVNAVQNNNCTMNLIGIVLIRANKNELRNNTVSENSNAGLQLEESEENIVTHNSLSKNSGGIVLIGANKNELRNNTVSENSGVGLKIQDSEENIVTHNSLSKNLYGIGLIGANKNELRNNTACENSDGGFGLTESEENIVTHNSLSRNLDGIVLIGANKNELRNNTACENSDVGLAIQESEENIVTHNSLSKNLDGIVLIGANKNELRNNTASENSNVGLKIRNSEENIVTHNSLFRNVHGMVLSSANKNELRNNTACENRNVGLAIQESEENIVTHNSLSRNLDGIVLIGANKNELRNNTASENSNVGLKIEESEENIVTHNSLSKNLDGIYLFRANKNELRNNTASENSNVGLAIQESEENIVTHNSLSKNLDGIVLILGASKNKLRNNNLVDSKDDQAKIQNSTHNTFDYNYWSDYTGEDKNRDGFGDDPYAIEGINQEDDYDNHPYRDYSGWLNVVIRPEYWEFYTKKGDINYFYNNFSIQNRLNSPTEVEILFEHNLEFVTDSERATTKTFCIAPKSMENITLRLNVTDLEGYILRTITFKTEDYTKTTLVYGLVQPKINAVKIEGVDYHRNVVLGQINPFNVILRNHGDRDEFEVTLKMGSQEIKKSVYLNETENKTIPFEIETSDMPLDINQGHVVVTKDNRLDYLNLTMFVAEKREASTLIVTNLERIRAKWGNDSVDKLKAKLIDLSFHPGVNGIIVDVEDETNCS
jgi:parallel beta-helix repeat protein